jgi:hypothetical protein
MSEPIVFALSTVSTTDPATGLIVRVSEGEPWAANDPFVKVKPELFGAAPERIRRTVPFQPPVEQASKAPGEKRTVKRG